MDSTPSIRDRIFSTADALYQDSGRQLFPTVDAVRKAAKVNMNDANTHMREWRRTQSSPVPAVTEPVPTVLQHASASALATLWSEATRLSNETLHAAEAAWQVERAEAEAIQEQLATAYDALAKKLEASQSEAATSDRRLTEHRDTIATLQQQLAQAQQETTNAAGATQQAIARAAEIERRATDLRQELDIAHRDLDVAARELRQERTTHDNETSALRKELDALRQGYEHTQGSLRQALSQAREEAAALRGRLAAVNPASDDAPPRRDKSKPDGASASPISARSTVPPPQRMNGFTMPPAAAVPPPHQQPPHPIRQGEQHADSRAPQQGNGNLCLPSAENGPPAVAANGRQFPP